MFSDEVKTAINAIRRVTPRINLQDRDVLLANLIFSHQLIVASESLLLAGIKQCAKPEVYLGQLFSYYTAHLLEESGHEKWLEKDLLEAGVVVSEKRLATLAVHIVGTQYYLVNHVHPACLLGYMAVMEGSPTPLELVDQLEATHGKELFRTLRYHADHDRSHSIDLFVAIDKTPVDLQGKVMDSAIQTALYLKQFAVMINSGGL